MWDAEGRGITGKGSSRTLLLCLTAALSGLSASPSRAAPAAPHQSCTSQWLSKRQSLPIADRFDRSRADAFGRQCLGGNGPKAIDWGDVQDQLVAVISESHPLTAIVPADIDQFCSRYRSGSRADRAVFWRTLALAVIRPEAGTNAHALMWEQPRNKAGQPVGDGEYSIGLLQLSLGNARPYGCDFGDEAALLDQRTNLSCGIKILARRVAAAQRIGGDENHGREGAARYWSTLRVIGMKPGGRGRETRRDILAATNDSPACR